MSKRKYKSRGIVLGNCWGGGQCSYQAKTIETDTREELIKIAKEQLEDGSLDSGMGYESLVGAILEIEERETQSIDGKDFYRDTYELSTIGEIPIEIEEELISQLGCS